VGERVLTEDGRVASDRAGGADAPEPRTASQPVGAHPSRATYAVSVLLQRHDGICATTTHTLSYLTNATQEQALASALEYAREIRPDFSIANWLVSEIPASAIEAGTGETEGLDPKGESAVAKPDAQGNTAHD